MQQDDDHEHTAGTTIEWFRSEQIHVFGNGQVKGQTDRHGIGNVKLPSVVCVDVCS